MLSESNIQLVIKPKPDPKTCTYLCQSRVKTVFHVRITEHSNHYTLGLHSRLSEYRVYSILAGVSDVMRSHLFFSQTWQKATEEGTQSLTSSGFHGNGTELSSKAG